MKISNKYVHNIERVEFILTDSCTGKCKHCSEGELKGTNKLNADIAAAALEKLLNLYEVDSIMTFGGEPLLCPESVYKIHSTAKKHNIRQRQIITNGCFSKNDDKINEVAQKLEECGVNDILLSIDCFHAEHLPLEWTRKFAVALKKYYTGRFRLQPSWVKAINNNNKYNIKTRECLAYFDDLNIELNEGDVIFPQGNATKYLSEYFTKEPLDLTFKCGDALYSSDLTNIDSICIDANGDVIPCSFSIGNIYNEDIVDIINNYDPYRNSYVKALVENGVAGLVDIARRDGIDIDLDKYYSPCDLCRDIFELSIK